MQPFEAITLQKQKKLLATAKDYLSRNPVELQPRFDAAAVYLRRGQIVGEKYLETAFSLT